ncbi:protocatechuate 3,4-dioxygenase [Paraburkholderia heleia]|uniref:protocatechuate 3,4-dioxygenase n=1 Tax=Paraburkholderia heleia TaxID=634127 RepID=UPI0031E0E6D1
MQSIRERDYEDIPGTYVFDGARCQKGFALNMFCKSLDLAANREFFRQNPDAYLSRFNLSAEQRNAVAARNWLEMLRLGGNIYYTFKLAIFDGLTMQHIGAAMSAKPMSVDEFRAMMVSGGRPISGNRSVKEQCNG